MTDIITYFQTIAEGYIPLSHSEENCRFAGSFEEFQLLAASKMKVLDFCLCLEVDISEWVNRNEAETEMTPVHLSILKQAKKEDFTANYTIMTEAKAHLKKIYSKIMKDRREGNPSSVCRFMDVSSKHFEYIAGGKGTYYLGAQLTLMLKLPVNYTFDPSDWN
jgi:hypothetical protein